MSDQTNLINYIVKLEATYTKLKQKMIRERNMFKGVLQNLSQNLGLKCNEPYFDTLVIQEEDPLTNWNVLLSKQDNFIKIRKEITKQETIQVKQKRKRRIKEEMQQQIKQK
ncbi:unnamed protein product (macronuclear) [Paramecium tetraurelia]|uniref:Uncharacterized protein n=1 Tax=Paramecium tetraurelia TaxID=5888 RepID=A0DCE9_PARTE|nr:uncharacterized protein GSPATT00015594001 [Paramecium tetraurelia]CAK80716.1 unnamed protein product [Paramecium tetraurelia]|eukprot:XP_001448113.1 hypothetical protein (macronuclear) [Paramecium tetraurelia strain d4-2]